MRDYPDHIGLWAYLGNHDYVKLKGPACCWWHHYLDLVLQLCKNGEGELNIIMHTFILSPLDCEYHYLLRVSAI